MSDELAKFMQARLDEDEAAARAAGADYTLPWGILPDEGGYPGCVADADGKAVGDLNCDDAAHIARHDPARVLREVQNKRAILEMWEPPEWVANPKLRPDAAENFHDGRDWNEIDEQVAAADAIDHVVRILACAWSDHPDFRQEWKP